MINGDQSDFFAAAAIIVAALIAGLAWHQLYREYRERKRR
jgi:hypothetical protein